jgi:hypothetical protein
MNELSGAVALGLRAFTMFVPLDAPGYVNGQCVLGEQTAGRKSDAPRI